MNNIKELLKTAKEALRIPPDILVSGMLGLTRSLHNFIDIDDSIVIYLLYEVINHIILYCMLILLFQI